MLPDFKSRSNGFRGSHTFISTVCCTVHPHGDYYPDKAGVSSCPLISSHLKPASTHTHMQSYTQRSPTRSLRNRHKHHEGFYRLFLNHISQVFLFFAIESVRYGDSAHHSLLISSLLKTACRKPNSRVCMRWLTVGSGWVCVCVAFIHACVCRSSWSQRAWETLAWLVTVCLSACYDSHDAAESKRAQIASRQSRRCLRASQSGYHR